MNQRSAISKINKNGLLLVFPMNNQKEPSSLWREFFPRTPLRWEWDEDGDNRVGEMWHLMKDLSDCRKVVYSKWYKGRATFFSREVFVASLRVLQNQSDLTGNLSRTSKNLLETLESDSPLSTKELKKLNELQGKFNEPEYNKSLKPLFSRLLVVGFGEVDDGAFPALALGSTKILYEDLWLESQSLKLSQAQQTLDKAMPLGSSFRKFFDKILQELPEMDTECTTSY